MARAGNPGNPGWRFFRQHFLEIAILFFFTALKWGRKQLLFLFFEKMMGPILFYQIFDFWLSSLVLSSFPENSVFHQPRIYKNWSRATAHSFHKIQPYTHLKEDIKGYKMSHRPFSNIVALKSYGAKCEDSGHFFSIFAKIYPR